MSDGVVEVDAVEPSDRIKPWTIKGIDPEERNAAIAAAEREGLTIGEWLKRAIRTQVQADRGSDRAPVPYPSPVSPQADQKADRRADLEAVERMVALARQISEVNQTPIPRSITRGAYTLMREHLAYLQAGRTNGSGG
jgi:hypothetical protein